MNTNFASTPFDCKSQNLQQTPTHLYASSFGTGYQQTYFIYLLNDFSLIVKARLKTITS